MVIVPARPPTLPQRRAVEGFTLIELMIAVAVVAILASVALPSYTDYVRRSRITEATNELSTLRVRLEQYFQDHRNYGDDGCGIGAASTESFDISCTTSGGGSEFLATATGKTDKSMNGYEFTIDQDNRRQTTAFPGTSGLPLNCWIDRKGAAC